MKNYAIIADATCDLSKEFREKYDIEVVDGHFVMPGGKEHKSICEWTEFTREEFYSMLKKAPNDFTTSPPNVAAFCEVFEKHAKAGDGVLAISISSGISGTYNFMLKAKEEVLEKYPNAEIEIVDSMRFGPGFGLLTIMASDLRKDGKTLTEVKDYLEENKNRIHQAGWLDDLSFVAKKGRLTHAKAFFGTLAGVKPMGEFDYNGLTTVIGKFKGEKAAYEGCLKYIEKTIIDPEDKIILIATTNRRKQAEIYKDMITERFHPKEIYVCDVFPSCGINVGPGLMAAYYIGTHISEGLVSERAIINDIINDKG